MRFSLRTLLLSFMFLSVMIWASVALYFWYTTIPTWPLKDAITEFNADAMNDRVGEHEPPLTEAEVISSIKAQLPSLKSDPEVYAVYERIIKTGQIPRAARLYFMSSYLPTNDDSPARDVWWINLRVMPFRHSNYGLHIRQNNTPAISSVAPGSEPP